MLVPSESMRDMLERSRLVIRWGGILGLLCHPIYYVVWTYVLPQPYDSLLLRLSAAIVCIPLIFQARWPKRFSNYLLIYWHCCLVYVLPFVCTFLTIRNAFSTMWMMTEVMMIFILALCIDSPLLLMACIGVGIVSSAMMAVLTSPTSIVLSATDLSNIALLPVVVLCSMAFSHAISKGRTSVEKNRALKALAGSIAHEMRNPLSQLRYVLDGVEEALPASTEVDHPLALPQANVASLYRHLAHGQLSIERGLRIISMTLDEVSAKPIRSDRLTYLGAAETTRKALDEYGFADEGERRKVRLHVLEDFSFKADETVYLFTLFNLIKNSLYHMAAHPTATLTLTVDQHTVVVRDTGPGISADMLPHLFEPFRTVGNSLGTGLGLAYCQRAMRAFGGTIRCRSELGKFTEFTLCFPPVSQSELESHHQAIWRQAMPAFINKRILVVDDIAIERRVLRQKLHGLPAHVDEAEDGLQALHMMRQHHYDLVLMDLKMPVLDGYATSAKIRGGEVPGHVSVPIIACTNEPPNIAKLKTEKVGMSGFVGKTCSRPELVQTLLRLALEQSSQACGEPALLAGKTVLLADDDPYGRAIICNWLHKHKVQVIEAAHGQAVLDHLAANLPCDVLVIDINMPGLDGLQTTRAIRTLPSAFRQLPIVALTGHSDAATIEAARAAGMDDFVSKPVEAAVLVQVLARKMKPSAQPPSAQRTSTPPKHDTSDASCAVPLLNHDRLETLRQDGMFDEYVDDYLGLLDPLLDRLEQGLIARDLKLVEQAMHSLLGASGNLGGVALHRLIRHTYEQVVAGRWPDDETWLSQIRTLTNQTVSALRTMLSEQ